MCCAQGQEQRIAAEELVPGDVMLLSEGDAISADGRLVQAFEFRVDQSTLSGESRPVRKASDAVAGTDLAHAELPNLVFAGTHVIAGTGRAVVVATGMATEFGKIAALTQAMGDQLSPLQKEIQVLTRIVSVFAVVAGLIFFAVSTLVAGMKLARSLHLCDRHDRSVRTRRAAADGDAILGHGCAAHGQA